MAASTTRPPAREAYQDRALTPAPPVCVSPTTLRLQGLPVATTTRPSTTNPKYPGRDLLPSSVPVASTLYTRGTRTRAAATTRPSSIKARPLDPDSIRLQRRTVGRAFLVRLDANLDGATQTVLWNLPLSPLLACEVWRGACNDVDNFTPSYSYTSSFCRPERITMVEEGHRGASLPLPPQAPLLPLLPHRTFR